jgi:anti-sigma factor RsiW
MEHSALTRLMHEVLDGVASADEARELDRLLANDPEARAQFNELARLFAGLNAMAKVHPPEGLVAAVLANLPRKHRRRDRLRQLSSRWRVLSVDSGRALGSNSNKTSRTQRNFQYKSIIRNRDMSGPNIISRKPKLWIGAGIAVVAIVLVARYFDFPPQMGTQGTIAPAKRVVAEQPGAGDVNGGQSDASRAAPPTSADASRDGSKDAIRDGSKDAIRDGSKDAIRDGSKDAIRDGAKDARDARDGAKDARDARDGAKDARDARDGAKDARDARDGAKDARDARDGAKDARDARDGSKDAVRDASPQ